VPPRPLKVMAASHHSRMSFKLLIDLDAAATVVYHGKA